MGEIIGGVIFMGLFIAFAMWKGKRSSGRLTNTESRLREDGNLDQKDEDSSGGFFGLSFGSSGGHDGDDSDDGGDD